MAKDVARNRAPPKAPRPTKLSIFVSYAREDSDLAASVHAELLQLFSFTPVEVFRDVGIPLAANYQSTIDQQLDGADILLVLITDRMKPSYSYTGYEVGFFRRSILNRPKIYGNVDRVIIPVCIGADSPDALHYVQSIQIDPDKVFKISGVDTMSEENQNPAATLLRSITGIVLNILRIPPSPVISDRLANSAARLYSLFCGYLQGRVSSETFPERKIIIRSDAPPAISSDGADLSATKIELVGASFQVFGFPEEEKREFTWAEFNTKMPPDMGGTWAEGIKALVAGTLHNNEENYHVVSTTKGDKAFRLFVSRIITYVSKKTEIHIYIVKMVIRHYGDPLTSRLLSAVSIGLQFRFLFLESSSKFRPARFEFPMAIDVSKEMDAWKSTVMELMSQMDLILREAQDQHLMDADLLDKIWGSNGGPRVQQMMGTWDAARAKLYTAAQQLLASSASEFVSKQDPFRAALRDLCVRTDVMNREYTLRALRSIADEIEGGANTSQDPPAVAATAPRSVSAH
jgi:hypothetical protein